MAECVWCVRAVAVVWVLLLLGSAYGTEEQTGCKTHSAQCPCYCPDAPMPPPEIPVTLPPPPCTCTCGCWSDILGEIHFDFDKADWPCFRESARFYDCRKELDDIARKIQAVPGRQLYVAGHVDSIGCVDYNTGLAERRVRTIAHLLWQRGIRNPMELGFFTENALISQDTSNKFSLAASMARRVEVRLSAPAYWHRAYHQF
eukprot:TRINITY_DN35883_c0_g1_i1.p2 TRINITY_DN35883_c0_g1~~TRINITY_DN35883_c0_g1_i1.p2  ORF type:complete len:209 (+),score=45.36 TRINITY_DN35883_c0_g1_i1:24-629(+)